jgi:hypothetical protein
MRPRAAALGALAATVGLAACTSGGGAGGSAAPVAASAGFSTTECGTYSGRGCARSSERVDLARPTFSNPTRITNPMYPISRLRSVVLLGHVGSKRFRTETTLLPGSHTIVWGRRRIEVLESQYVAFEAGQLVELAIDRFAQDDSGNVWYLGEDVFDYSRGTVSSTEGTWLAGRDGPGAMIMPAHAKLGDVFRTENVPGIVFEEVTVKSVDRTVAGPRGPVRGAMVGRELHLDRTTENKLFAPGYGEFRTSGGGDLEALALAVPTDRRRGPMPSELREIATAAAGVVGSVHAEDWKGAAATLRRMTADWDKLRARRVPPLLEGQMNAALARLRKAVEARKVVPAGLAAADVSEANFDFELQYRPPVEIDKARFQLWASRVLLHAHAHDLGAVMGDVATLELIRDRFAHALDPTGRRQLDAGLRDVRAAADARNVAAAADHAARLAARLHALVGPD